MQSFTKDNVDIYIFKISSYINDVDECFNFLSADEKDRVERYKFNKDKTSYTLARGKLRSILTNYIDIKPCSIIFSYGEFGKPELVKEQNIKNIQFNVSHSGEYIIIGISESGAIGVDVEKVSEDIDLPSISERFFSADEAVYLNNLSKDKGLKSFFKVWTQKEALIKANGKGLSFGLNSWSTKPEEDSYLIYIDDKKYSVTNIDITDEYYGALCKCLET